MLSNSQEKLAKRLIKKWDLAPETLRTWRFRGEIPTEYLEGEPVTISTAARRKIDQGWIDSFESSIAELPSSAQDKFYDYYHNHIVSSAMEERKLKQRLWDAKRYAQR